MNLRRFFIVLLVCMMGIFAWGQNHNHDHHGHQHDESHNHAHDHSDHAHGDDHSHGHHPNYIISNPSEACDVSVTEDHDHTYDPTATAIHHISDANVMTIMDMVRIPLPAILYSKDRGVEVFSTGKFHPGHHDNGSQSYNGYVLFEGNIHKMACPDLFTTGQQSIDGFGRAEIENAEGKKVEKRYAIVDGRGYLLEQKTIWDGGMLGGGITSFYDLSPTKNVISMILVALVLFLMFRTAAKAYTTRAGKAPSGLQSFLEPVFQFIRDDVAVPFIGEKKYEKYLPLLMTIFFFILGLNLWGQVPFLGSVNVTGSLTVTMVMAVLVFLITNFSGNKHYWQHILNMPGVPWFVKLILTPVEILGMFIKPLTLMLRLAGNITAGHIAILSFVGLIFIFGKSGTSLAGSLTGTAMAIPLTIFMMSIELIVAFVQAFVFTILTASYIGAAVEDHH